MPWLISIIVSLITGAVGLLAAGWIANLCVSWYSVTSREGAAGYFVVFTALLGGLASIIIALIAARLIANNLGSSFIKELGTALGSVLLIAAIALGLCRFFADVPPTLDGRDLMLEVEFRLPTSTPTDKPPTTEGEWKVRLVSIDGNMHGTNRDGDVYGDKSRLDDGRWIVPCDVFLFTERSNRAVSLHQNEKDMGSFLITMPAHPRHKFEQWSEWLPRQQAGGSAWPADKTSYRFRIQKIPEPPPPPTEAEYKAAQDAEKEAEFAAIADDAPISAWFEYTKYEQPQTKRALEKIVARPDYINQLRTLALGDDAEAAHAALQCISILPEPSKELNSVVEAAAKKITEGIVAFNSTPQEADPSFEGAVAPATRFYGWIAAARALREKSDGDFTNELKSILELSRVRPESHCMRQDICRVASYYLQQWAGIEPLPTDPKPK